MDFFLIFNKLSICFSFSKHFLCVLMQKELFFRVVFLKYMSVCYVLYYVPLLPPL